jgi:hypothetical protein
VIGAVRCCAIACVLASLSHGCTDPGCIRNSECQANARCIEAVCVRSNGDAGVVPVEPTSPSHPAAPSGEDAGN